ncbi:MAG: anti-sigma F factor, partial [Defluviitaleaceae bacterium]|nr:anti-sigma F factor [Defluviitaleaceae bacterium]
FLDGDTVTISVKDEGAGIHDVDQARTPLFTTKPDDERSGMGFTVMESFMDSVEVISAEGKGTEIVMRKRFANGQDAATD